MLVRVRSFRRFEAGARMRAEKWPSIDSIGCPGSADFKGSTVAAFEALFYTGPMIVDEETGSVLQPDGFPQTARRDLPLLWQRAEDGFASVYSVGVVVSAAGPLASPVDAPQEIRDAEARALAQLDEAAHDWVLTCSSAVLRQKAKKLVDRITGDSAARRHTRAMADRKVVCSPAGDGMSWLGTLMPTHEAVAAMRRLSATAKHTPFRLSRLRRFRSTTGCARARRER
ncbi:hypothetical protein [Microbacterium sp. YJN-G]|uniref:hypothetical protein n=1 Tax=Microbacterium sp. YJN-G TaxID=2763257 RepID=UPI0039B6FFAE